MKRETLEKIRRIAADTRGDPAMREVARRILKEHEPDEIVGFPLGGFKDPRHPGLRPSEEFLRLRFFDLEKWKRAKSGVRYLSLFYKGRFYQVELRQRRWKLTDLNSGEKAVSEREYATISEAQEAAWNAIETMHSTPPSTKP